MPLAIGTTLLVVLTALLPVSQRRQSLDSVVAGWVHQHPHPALAQAMRLLTSLGSASVAVTVLAASVLLAARRGVTRGQLLATVGWFLAGLSIRYLLVTAVDRSRPPTAWHLISISGASFPSGHATTATLAFGLSAGLLGDARLCPRWLLWSAAVAASSTVALSRVLLDVHWVSDVIAGCALGLIVVALNRIGNARTSSQGRSMPR